MLTGGASLERFSFITAFGDWPSSEMTTPDRVRRQDFPR